jgi:hypothetical protein
MYTSKRIEKVLEKVFGDEEKRVYFNGIRAEGLSFIFLDAVCSTDAKKLLQALNEEFTDEQPLEGWRVVRGTRENVVTKEIPEEDILDTLEVRFIYSNWNNK